MSRGSVARAHRRVYLCGPGYFIVSIPPKKTMVYVCVYHKTPSSSCLLSSKNPSATHRGSCSKNTPACTDPRSLNSTLASAGTQSSRRAVPFPRLRRREKEPRVRHSQGAACLSLVIYCRRHRPASLDFEHIS